MSSRLQAEARPGIFRSAAFRLSLGFAGLFVSGLLALDLGVGLGARHLVGSAMRSAVEEEFDRLLDIYDRAGAAGLARRVDEVAADPDAEIAEIGLSDATGSLLAGSLSFSDEPPVGWSVFAPEDADEDEALWVKTALLPGGEFLSVAADSETYHDVGELMLAGAAWTVAIALPLALLSGALLSRAVLRRLQQIAGTVEAVRRGALSPRAPVRVPSDEFDNLARDINAMLDTIEALTRNLRNVSVGIAHELRTPLAHVRNHLVDIQSGRAGSGKTTLGVGDAITEIDGALATFDALLKIGQIEADAERRGFERVKLSELVAELAEVYEPVAVEHGMRLIARVNPGIEVDGNRALLAQLISNLLENAIEHTPPGTTISLELGIDGIHRKLSVTDDGQGIPADESERVFDRFYRLDRSRSKPGSGLGLSLVRSICSLHGFAVGLEPSSTGARFVVVM